MRSNVGVMKSKPKVRRRFTEKGRRMIKYLEKEGKVKSPHAVTIAKNHKKGLITKKYAEQIKRKR